VVKKGMQWEIAVKNPVGMCGKPFLKPIGQAIAYVNHYLLAI